MNDLTNEQKQLITKKQEEYHDLSTKVSLLQNEIATLSTDKSRVLSEYEKAKIEYYSLNCKYFEKLNDFNISRSEYINKGEIKFIFSVLGFAFAGAFVINLLRNLVGIIDILSFKDAINYFLCVPLLGSAISISIASVFSDKVRQKLLSEFNNLDNTKNLSKKIEDDLILVTEKKSIYERLTNELKGIKYHIEQLEYKVKCNKYEMDKIKSCIFDIIYNSEYSLEDYSQGETITQSNNSLTMKKKS